MGADPRYKVGQLGLNLVASPLHLTEDALLAAQNVERVRDAGIGGIGSRRGLAPFHPDGLGGEIVSMFNVPLDSEGFGGGGGFLSAIFGFTNGAEEIVWLGTDDAVTFPEQADPVQDGAIGTDTLARQSSFATLDGVLYYLSAGGASGTIWSWNGTTNTEVIDTWPDPGGGYTFFGVYKMIAANGVLYISTLYTGMADNRMYVYVWDGVTLEQVGDPVTGTSAEMVPIGLAYCFDLLFAGMDDTNGAPEIYRIDPSGAGAWTLDETFAATLMLNDLFTFDAELYAAFAPVTQGGGTNGAVHVRNSSGSWSESFAGPDDDAEFVGPMVEYLGELYLAWSNRSVTPRASIYRYDGLSWVEDLDIITEFSLDGTDLQRGFPVVAVDCLLWLWMDINNPANADILKRTAGADWSLAVENELLHNYCGGVGSA